MSIRTLELVGRGASQSSNDPGTPSTVPTPNGCPGAGISPPGVVCTIAEIYSATGVLMLLMRKLGNQEVRELAQCHTSREW